jgi:excinuclease ABC subunit A
VDKVVGVDQSPIGRTPRSNPATYTGVFDHVRKLFASTTEAKVRGYQQGRFSFNVKGGRCEACAGDGTLKIEMNFLPDIYVPCEVCKGARFNRETLEVHYKGKNIAEVLDTTIEEAADFFEAIGPIHRHLKTLVEVGLGYVRLGQPAPTLSGGEAQRVKLAAELQKRSTGRTVYVLDEPTTGLHFADTEKLLGVINGLVDKGNTVIVIEHNLDVIKTADHVIDMGPEGGSGGGLVIAEGTPEEIVASPGSYTGQFLAPILAGRKVRAAADIVDDIARADPVPAPKRPRRNSATGIGVNGSGSSALNRSALDSSAKLPGTSTASKVAAAAAGATNGGTAAGKNGSTRTVTKSAPGKAAPAGTASAKTAPTKKVPTKVVTTSGPTEQATIAAKARRKAAKLI